MDLLTGIVILTGVAAAWDGVRRFTTRQASLADLAARVDAHASMFDKGLGDHAERLKQLEVIAGGFKNAIENQKALAAKVAGRWGVR